jgi:hypothetical protein
MYSQFARFLSQTLTFHRVCTPLRYFPLEMQHEPLWLSLLVPQKWVWDLTTFVFSIFAARLYFVSHRTALRRFANSFHEQSSPQRDENVVILSAHDTAKVVTRFWYCESDQQLDLEPLENQKMSPLDGEHVRENT